MIESQRAHHALDHYLNERLRIVGDLVGGVTVDNAVRYEERLLHVDKVIDVLRRLVADLDSVKKPMEISQYALDNV